MKGLRLIVVRRRRVVRNVLRIRLSRTHASFRSSTYSASDRTCTGTFSLSTHCSEYGLSRYKLIRMNKRPCGAMTRKSSDQRPILVGIVVKRLH